MAGPSGKHYSLNRVGQIELSRYAQAPSGYYFPFPPRHTLPTRMIVPNGTSASCYECHRLVCPMPTGAGSGAAPVALPATAGDTTGLHRLTDHPAADVNGVWSPDGQWIAWVSQRSGSFQVWLMRPDGTRPRQLTMEPAIHGWPAWSPDGMHLAVWGHDSSTGESSISIVDRRDGQSRVLVRSLESLDRPSWRPDGRYIAYAGQQGNNWDVWVASVEGRQRHRLTFDSQMETNPLWSPDGSTIAYKVASDKEYNLTVENFVSVRAGFDQPQLTAWNSIQSLQMNAWSPDGRHIAYTAEMLTNASGEDRVSYRAVIQALTTEAGKHLGTPVVLSGNVTLGDRGPVFSPSGDRVCFWAWDRSYQASLWIANADGSGLKQVTRGGMDMVPQWSPDGSKILFESGRGGNLDLWTLTVP
jgi:Tol biopolymer transport system component